MINAIIQATSHLLGLLEQKEKNKYFDKYLKLKEKHYKAVNQPDDKMDHAVIDNLERELKDLFVFVTKKLNDK